MPVLKFRSVGELDARRRDLDCVPPDGRWLLRIARLWERSSRLNPRRFPVGVHRYRGVAEADAEREAWLLEHVRRLRAERTAERTAAPCRGRDGGRPSGGDSPADGPVGSTD